jgi:hypothetical protein
MSVHHFLVACVFSCVTSVASAGAFDYGVLAGEWGAYKSNWFESDWYQYLKLTNEAGGVFAYSYGSDLLVFPFSASDVRREDGLIVVSLRRPNEAPFRLAISGWRLANGMALVSGSLFMYQQSSNGGEVLFNSIPVRLASLQTDEGLRHKLESVRGKVAK